MAKLTKMPPSDKEYEGQGKLGLEARYDELSTYREPYLKRARKASKLTIPSLMPPESTSATTELHTPWQSIGSRGCTNLAAKLLLALLSPGFFRYVISQAALDKLTQDESLKSQYEEGLAKYEKEIMSEIESGTIRVSSNEALLHLIVCGNVLPYLPPKGGMKVYHLDSYVVQRDPMGNLLEIIAQERLSLETVPAEIREMVRGTCKTGEKSVNLYTCVKREDDHYETWQEVRGIEVPDSRGTYALDKCPWMPLRWTKIDGQDYGRGHVESLQGDLNSVEGLSQAIVEGSVAAAKVLFLVNPNGVTKQKTVAEAPNGAIRTGKMDDVTVVQMNKFNDFRTTKDTLDGIEQRLQASFLLNSSVTRNAERVTAEEIRFMASELESALGGVYSLLAQEFQLPLIARITDQMVKQKRLKPLPKGIVKPIIVTGLEALTRGNDQQKLTVFMSGLQQLGPEVIAQYVNLTDYITRLATSIGINQKGLIKSDDEVAQAQQQAQMQNMIQTVAPNATKAIGDISRDRLAQQQGQAQEPQ